MLKAEYHENFVQRNTMKKKLEVYEKLYNILSCYMFVNKPYNFDNILPCRWYREVHQLQSRQDILC